MSRLDSIVFVGPLPKRLTEPPDADHPTFPVDVIPLKADLLAGS
jgi:hypothetical protein